MSLPLRLSRRESTKMVKLDILRRFQYDALMMMSGVIVKAESSSSTCERAQVLIKGAPYEVSQLAEPDTLPKDWAQVRCCSNIHVRRLWGQAHVVHDKRKLVD